MKRGMIRLTFALVLVVSTWGLAGATAYNPLDLSAYVNGDYMSWTGGYGYPAPGTINIGGVDFRLSPISPGRTGVIAFNPSPPGSAVSITTNIANVTNAYVIVNSAWGSYGTNIGSISFFGSGGASYTYELFEGANVRDHYNGAYVNTITAPNWLPGSPQYPSGARLDAYNIALPAAFAHESLVGILLAGYGRGGDGSPAVAAITTSSTPIPAAAWLLGTGAAGLLGLGRRFRKT